jgi:hypothetical protein
MKIVAAVVGVFIFVIVLLGFGYLGFSNTARSYEVDIKAKYTNNKNVYDNGWKRIRELAQVPDMQVEQLQKLYDTAMKGRYGVDGSKAMVQFIHEQNPTLAPDTYNAISRNIESFRLEFASNQTGLISVKQEYERFLTATTNGRFYNTIGGYPAIDLTQYDIITSEQTEQDFKTKKSEPITLRPQGGEAGTKG